ncbi:peptidylprolyl isomerase [uncultured Ruthenibacterium sp.]|uniref:peptidylprolyl isomerase n=1 Tax=uncultured Ruthenibacterium sp. TaxID=1905347 RepID=UPI00349E7155
MLRRIFSLLCVVATILGLTGCSDQTGFAGSSRKAIESSETQFAEPSSDAQVAILSTSMGDISIVLFPEYAPMAVENFVGLAQQGYYNGNLFHRVVADFIIQTGDATQTGSGGASIWNNNSYPNELSDQLHHYSGAVALARAADGSVGNLSQFYIVQTPEDSINKNTADELLQAGVRQEVVDTYKSAGGAPYLDGQDTVFGQVYDGMDVVDAIAQAECDENGRPLENITLNSVTITTYGAINPASDTSSTSGNAQSSAS